MKLHEKDNFSRRNFLKTSILAGGGMLIGFNLLTACKLEAKMPIDIGYRLTHTEFSKIY